MPMQAAETSAFRLVSADQPGPEPDDAALSPARSLTPGGGRVARRWLLLTGLVALLLAGVAIVEGFEWNRYQTAFVRQQGRANRAEASLADTTSRLNDTDQRLADTQASLAATTTKLNETRANLDAANSQIADYKSKVARLGTDLSHAQDDAAVNAAEADRYRRAALKLAQAGDDFEKGLDNVSLALSAMADRNLSIANTYISRAGGYIRAARAEQQEALDILNGH